MPDGIRDETPDGTQGETLDVEATITRIVAIGSPFADDQAGWRAAERLMVGPIAEGEFTAGEFTAGDSTVGDVSRVSPVTVPVIRLARPLDLLDHLVGCRRLLILDACRTGAHPGSIVRLQWPDPRIESVVFASSHLLGLADALRLAECLGRLPQQVVILGIELRESSGHFQLSEDVQRALPELERRVREELDDPHAQPYAQPKQRPSCA